MVSLKGRSAYLKKYADSVCDKIWRIPEVQQSNLKDKIYCSGGKFYLQVPNTESVIEQIEMIKSQVSKDLWQEHKGQLSINISCVPFDYTNDKREQVLLSDGKPQKIGILWRKITEDFAVCKSQKFKNIILNECDDFFKVRDVGTSTKVCAVTGIEGEECVKIEKNADGEEIWVLRSVKEQIKLGQELRDKYHFKTLEDYAGNSKLGILRMDVDGLGKVFIDGFDNMELYKEFSKKLDHFFDAEEGILFQIKRQDKYKNEMNIVYAGGDDIFAVGKWNVIIDFSADVRTHFIDYIQKNCSALIKDCNTISISGGVVIVGAKFPISKSAALAGEAEEASKAYIYNGKPKNAINFLGETVSWDYEFDYVRKYKGFFVEYIEKHGLSRGILHKIMTYAAIVKENQIITEENNNGNNRRQPNMSYLWHTSYYLTRYMEANKSKCKVVEFCKDLRDKQLLNAEKYRLMALAARWAELELRMKNTEKDENR